MLLARSKWGTNYLLLVFLFIFLFSFVKAEGTQGGNLEIGNNNGNLPTVIVSSADNIPSGQGGNSSFNETYLNSLYWRLDGSNDPPTANWDMGTRTLHFTAANQWNISASGSELLIDSNAASNLRINSNMYFQQKSGSNIAFIIDEAIAGSATDLFVVIADGVQRFAVDNHGDFRARNGTMTNLSAVKIISEQVNITSNNVRSYYNGSEICTSANGLCGGSGGYITDQPFNSVNQTNNVTFAGINVTKHLNVGDVMNTTNLVTLRAKDNPANNNYTLLIENRSGADQLRFSTNGKLCIGSGECDANFFSLQINEEGNANGLRAQVASTTAGVAPNFQFIRARNTLASRQSVTNGDSIFNIQMGGYDGTANRITANLGARVDGVNSSTVIPIEMFMRTGNATTNIADRIRIPSSGNIMLNESVYISLIDSNRRGLVIQGINDSDLTIIQTGNLMEWGIFDVWSMGGNTPSYTGYGGIDNNGTVFSPSFRVMPSTFPTCNSGTAGEIRYNTTGHYGCNITNWNKLY